MRPALPVLLVVSALVLLVATVPARPASPAAFDPAPASVVFGGPGRFDGGTLVVGRYVPAPPSHRLVDLIPPERYAAFLAEEARRAAAGEPEEEAEVAFEDAVPLGDPPDVRQHLPEGLRLAAEHVLAQAGVHVEFPPLLAEELGTSRVPVLVVEGPVASPVEQKAIDAARERGMAIVTSTERDAVLPVLQEALRSSPHVQRLAVDPLGVVSARRVGDLVEVRLASRPDAVDLRDLEDVRVGEVALGAGGDLSFVCADAGALPWTTRLVVTKAVEGTVLRRAYRVLDLVGASSLRVLASNTAEAGAPYAPRVLVQNLKTGEPVGGRRIALHLERAGVVLASATVTSDATGSADVRLRVPEDTEPGVVDLRVDGERYPVHVTSGLALSLVTDRSLYRPTDEVHARVMVHRRATGRPVPSTEVVLTLGDAERRVTTSAHGIASATFRLDRASVGVRPLKAAAGGQASSTDLRIRAFETPTFLLSVEPAALVVREGEEVPVVVRGRYVNGAPLVGAEVTAEPGRDAKRDVVRGVTDAEGTFRFAWRGMPGRHSGTLEITVRDADGHEQRRWLPWRDRSAEDERPLSVTPLEDVVAGIPARYRVSGPPGATVAVRPGDAPAETVALDEKGWGEASILLQAPTDTLQLLGGGRARTEVAEWVVTGRSGLPLVVPPRRTARVGETLDLVVRASDGPAYVDVWRDGTMLLRSLSCSVVDGVGTLPLVLDEDLAGLLVLRAWRLEGESVRGSSVTLLVTRGRALEVTAAPERPDYRPAERAVVEVSVRDRDGRPTAAALGYWGVDEALLAIAPWGRDREPVFDLFADSPAGPLGLALDADGDTPVAHEQAVSVLGRIAVDQDATGFFAIRDRIAPKHERAVAEAASGRFEASVSAARKAVAAAFDRIPLEEIRTAHSIREMLRRVVAGGWLAPEAVNDAWGTPLRIDGDLRAWKRVHDGEPPYLSWSVSWGAPCRSAGPDLRFGTADDLVLLWEPLALGEVGGRLRRFLALVEGALGPAEARLLDAPFLGPVTNGMIGIGGGAGGSFRGRGGSRDLRTGGGGRASSPEVLHVRRDFSPTLCFVPEVIVGPEGRARLEIPLRDSITTWRMRFVASAESGAVGVGTTAIRVTQPLHLEPWVASHLTVGDEIDLPVAVRNETGEALEVATAITVKGGLQVLGPDREVVRVGPGGTQAVTFRLRATVRGEARVRLDGAAGGHGDAVERIVHVHAAEREVVHAASGTLAGGDSWTAALPVLAAAAPSESRVSVYPSPMAETLAGFDGLIQCPHG